MLYLGSERHDSSHQLGFINQSLKDGNPLQRERKHLWKSCGFPTNKDFFFTQSINDWNRLSSYGNFEHLQGCFTLKLIATDSGCCSPPWHRQPCNNFASHSWYLWISSSLTVIKKSSRCSSIAPVLRISSNNLILLVIPVLLWFATFSQASDCFCMHCVDLWGPVNSLWCFFDVKSPLGVSPEIISVRLKMEKVMAKQEMRTSRKTWKGWWLYCWWFRNPKQPPGMVL